MGNNISYKQNQPLQLDYLAAQRALYTKAKNHSSAQLFLSVPLIIVISIATLVLNDKVLAQKIGIQQLDISWVAASIGIMVTLLDTLYFVPIIHRLKNRAAKIQELFDTSVLHLPWNEIAVGSKPDHEEINQYSHLIRKKEAEIAELEDWYSDKLDDIPLSAATIVCQRSNLCWDADLRNYFSGAIGVAGLLLVLLLFVMGLYGELTLNRFFLIVLAPALPIIIYTSRQIIENRKAIDQLTTLKDLLNTTWNELLSGKKSEGYVLQRARKIQDQIYSNRKGNPLIFDWVYEKRKSEQHKSMFYSIDQMLDEYIH